MDTKPPDPQRSHRTIYRHTLPVRLAHWLNVFCLPILIMSGLQIFNAHPALYFGNRSDRDHPVFSIQSGTDETGVARGVTTLMGWEFDTTGWLGVSFDGGGRSASAGLPRVGDDSQRPVAFDGAALALFLWLDFCDQWPALRPLLPGQPTLLP